MQLDFNDQTLVEVIERLLVDYAALQVRGGRRETLFVSRCSGSQPPGESSVRVNDELTTVQRLPAEDFRQGRANPRAGRPDVKIHFCS